MLILVFVRPIVPFKVLLLLAVSLQQTPVNAQEQPYLDFIRANARIQVLPEIKTVSGSVNYSLSLRERRDSVFINARNMNIKEVEINNKKAKFTYDGNKIYVLKKFKPQKTYDFEIRYAAQPRKAVYFLGWDDEIKGNEQVWTQGQGQNSSHWIPSPDDMNEKVIFNLQITADSTYQVIANGRRLHYETRDSLGITSFEMEKPMSSYLLAFVIGNYKEYSTKSKSGIPLYNYLYPQDSLKLEPTYRYTAEIMDFFEKETGIPYPWGEYRQIPVRDFLYAGMENTAATIFSEAYVVDSVSFNDQNYVSVNAHEMAHQWFGNLVTEYSGDHHWLHEGFATYYSLLAQRHILGDETFYFQLYKSARELHKMNLEGKGESLLDPKASSLTFYEKGAWALHVLREQLGEKQFRKGITKFLQTHAFANARVSEFLRIMETETAADLSAFRTEWLESKEFHYEETRDILKESSWSLGQLYKLEAELVSSVAESEGIIRRYWDPQLSEEIKSWIVARYIKTLSEDFVLGLFNNEGLKVRQALALHLDRIPESLKPAFESLLEDPSYRTIESALFKLWIHYPNERVSYLEKTKGMIGLPNRNVRILWLLLAILTRDFESNEDRLAYEQELMGYTAPHYPFEVRQMAFSVILEVFALPDQGIRDLVDACSHHAWRFRKFSRSLLVQVARDETQRERIMALYSEFGEKEQRLINELLESR